MNYFSRDTKVIHARLCLFVILLTAPTFALAGKFHIEPVNQCIIENLRVHLEKDFPVRKGTLPDEIVLDVGKKEASELFNVAVNLWNEEWPKTIDRLEVIAGKATKTGRITENESDELSDLRTELKMMRYIFQALSDDHDAPDEVDEIATAVGKLRDRTVDGLTDESRKAGKRVLDALSDKHVEKIDRAVARFHPTHRKPFAKWVSDTLDETEELVRRGKGTPAQEHQIRKNLQAFLTVIQIQFSIEPKNVPLRQAYRILVRDTELLGGKVDENDTLAIEGRLDLKKDEIAFDPRLMAEIQDVLDRIKKGSF